VESRLPAEEAGSPDTTLAEAAGSPDTTLAEPNPNSNTHQIKNETVNVVVQQRSRKLLNMGI